MMRKRTSAASEDVLTEKKTTPRAQKKSAGSSSAKKGFGFFLFIALFVLYFVIPLTIYLCPSVRRQAVFLNYVSLSRQRNLSQPSESGLVCARNLYIESDEEVRLGVWHVPPQSALSKCKNGIIPVEDAFKDNRPVFLYLHGNAGTRAGNHRVELYKIFSSKLDAHVVAFDYRGFGDSSNVSPTESGLVNDTHHVFEWLRQKVALSRVFIWGHSLGTGVGVAFLETLAKKNYKPAGLILEAPFTRIIDAAKYHPLSIFHRYMPFFETFIAEPIGDKDTGFDSIGRIPRVHCNLLILHAEDDGFVPFHHGKKLYNEAVIARKGSSSYQTEFVAFAGELDFGHKNIYLSPELPNIIQNFISNTNEKPKV